MKTIRLEGLIFGAAILFAPIAVLAQIPAAGSSAAQNQSAAEMASLSSNDLSTNASAGVDTQVMKDKMFVHKIALGGFAEVHFGQLAAQKATSDDVKKLGQKLADDHTVMDNDLKAAADELGVRTPTKMSKEDQEDFDKLNALSGSDFDKAYLAYALKAHRRDLHEFRTEVAQTNDPQIKEAIAGMEATVAGHLYVVNKLALANGVASAHKMGGQTPVAPPQ